MGRRSLQAYAGSLPEVTFVTEVLSVSATEGNWNSGLGFDAQLSDSCVVHIFCLGGRRRILGERTNAARARIYQYYSSSTI